MVDSMTSSTNIDTYNTNCNNGKDDHNQVSFSTTISNENNNEVDVGNSLSNINLNMNENYEYYANNNNEDDNANNNKNVPKLHDVPCVAEYLKSNYQDMEKLSTSLIGQIMTGTHIQSGRVHCIKIFSKEMQKAVSDRIAENCQNEIDAMEAICTQNHPYLIQLIDAIEDSESYVIILEYAPDGDMCFHLQKLGRGLPRVQAQKYFKQLVEAVAFVHSKGYCHLDISLENILLDKSNDCVKLCDFGMSRAFLNDNEAFPVSYLRSGKKSYMAPEIVSYESFYGDKADSFSLGVILFMFLTGSPPFRIASAQDVCFRCLYTGNMDRLLRECKLLSFFSLEAKDLLNKIFTHSENRISVKEILAHPWLQNDGKC